MTKEQELIGIINEHAPKVMEVIASLIPTVTTATSATAVFGFIAPVMLGMIGTIKDWVERAWKKEVYGRVLDYHTPTRSELEKYFTDSSRNDPNNPQAFSREVQNKQWNLLLQYHKPLFIAETDPIAQEFFREELEQGRYRDIIAGFGGYLQYRDTIGESSQVRNTIREFVQALLNVGITALSEEMRKRLIAELKAKLKERAS